MSVRVPVPDRTRVLERREHPVVRVLALAGLLVLWELVTRTGRVPSLFLPSPLDVIQSGVEMLRSGEPYSGYRSSQVSKLDSSADCQISAGRSCRVRISRASDCRNCCSLKRPARRSAISATVVVTPSLNHKARVYVS